MKTKLSIKSTYIIDNDRHVFRLEEDSGFVQRTTEFFLLPYWLVGIWQEEPA